MASRGSDSSAYSSSANAPRRLNDGIKQRIVGALVLVALGVIFLPSLFDREGVRYINVTSQIPPAPDIQPITIAEPTPVEGVEPAPPVNEVFQPEFVAQAGPAPDPDMPLAAQDKAATTGTAPRRPDAASTATVATEQVESGPVDAGDSDKPASKPEPEQVAKKTQLDENNLPEGWVVQVGAYREATSANRMRAKLLDAGFRAYTRAVDTGNGRFVRVFVGPKLEKTDAQSDKRKLDKLLRAETLVLRYKA